MRKRHRYTLKENLISAAIGAVIAIPLCVGHVASVNHYKEVQRQAVMEQIRLDNAKEAEIQRYKEAERQEDAAFYAAVEKFQAEQASEGGGEN